MSAASAQKPHHKEMMWIKVQTRQFFWETDSITNLTKTYTPEGQTAHALTSYLLHIDNICCL